MRMEGLPQVVYAIDDNESFLKALLRLLRSVGLQARGFGSLEALNASLPLPSSACLIIDIILGRESGLDVPGELSVRGEEPPLVFMSATDDRDLLARAAQISKQPCLHKPFEAEALFVALSRAMKLDGKD